MKVEINLIVLYNLFAKAYLVSTVYEEIVEY